MMTEDDAKALIKQGDHLFDKRGSLLSMWQSIADNFYPERADFTVSRSLGDDFADNLTTSYPLLVRRDLGNSLGTATAAALLVGVNAASVPTPWGGTVLVTPGFVVAMSLPAAGLGLPLPVPNDPLLCLGTVRMQGFVFDAGATGGVAESAGLRLTLGR